MSKFIIGVIVIGVLAAGFFLYAPEQGRETSPSTAIPPPASPLPPPRPFDEEVIEMAPAGFVPSALTIPAGHTVRFVNKDSVARWPASAVHPTHQICPGFDSLKPIQPGESYSFTFIEVKTCPMHDHLNPELGGSIIVEPAGK